MLYRQFTQSVITIHLSIGGRFRVNHALLNCSEHSPRRRVAIVCSVRSHGVVLAKPDPLTIVIPTAQRKLQMTRHFNFTMCCPSQSYSTIEQSNYAVYVLLNGSYSSCVDSRESSRPSAIVEDWYQKATTFFSYFSAIRQSFFPLIKAFCLGGEGTFAKKQRLIVGYRTKEARLAFQSGKYVTPGPSCSKAG